MNSFKIKLPILKSKFAKNRFCLHFVEELICTCSPGLKGDIGPVGTPGMAIKGDKVNIYIFLL